MIATSVPFTMEHERRGVLIAELETTSSDGGLMKMTKADFSREAMRIHSDYQTAARSPIFMYRLSE
jgi:hypothetical protein